MRFERYQIKTIPILKPMFFIIRVLTLVSGFVLLGACEDLKLNSADLIVQRIGDALIEPNDNSVFFNIELMDLYVVQDGNKSIPLDVQSNESLKTDALINDYPYKVFTISWMGKSTTNIEFRGKLHYKLKSTLSAYDPIYTITDTTDRSFATLGGIQPNMSILISFSPNFLSEDKAADLDELKKYIYMDVSYTLLRKL